MDFNLPVELTAYLAELDAFIEREIVPLQAQDDNERFFDHRREWARTDFDNQGLPRPEWEALMAEARRRADRAGHLRFGLPREYGGRDGSHLWMAVIREHLAAKGLGLHNDLQTEHSIVANNPLRAGDPRLRHAGAARSVHPGHARRNRAHGVRPHRARARVGRHAHGDACSARVAQRPRGLADRRREDVDHRHARGHALCGVRAHRRARPATHAASARCWCPPTPTA